MLVEAWLHRAARTRPDTVALRADDGALTYAELHGAATLAAQRLSALGVRPGDRVAIALPARRAFVETLHGCLLLGAARGADRPAPEAGRAPRAHGRAARPSSAGRSTGSPTRAPPLTGTHDLDATAIVVHTSGTTSGPRAGRADVRQLAVERAGLGRGARRPSATTSGCARCRCRTSAACRSSCAARSTPRASSCTSASRPRPPPTRSRPARRSSRSCRRRSRGCSTPACATRRSCARRSSAAPRSRRRCSSARPPPACRPSPPTA